MANFDKAVELILKREGIYSNDPKDPGGETCYGISMVHNPDWEGWKEVDQFKGCNYLRGELEENITKDSKILQLAKQLYKTKYWDINFCDELPQDLSERLYDIAVHIGQRISSLWFQRSINLMFQTNYCKEDGIVGPKTISFYKEIKDDRKNIVIATLVAMQRQWYIDLANKNDYHRKNYVGYVRRTL